MSSVIERIGTAAAIFSMATLSILVLAAPPAHGAVDVSHFSLTPSTTAAAGHPNLRITVRFAEPTTGLKDVALHLPTGLRAHPEAIPFCSRRRLLADLCPSRAKAGSVTIVGLAWGFELAVTRKIYNLRPGPSERLRLAVPVFGSWSRPGVAIELPVTERAGDKGLDMAVLDIPREVNGVAVRVKELTFSLKGVARTRVKKRLRTSPYLTNPASCAPATSVLEVSSHDAPATPVVRTTAFTPTGCAGG